MPSTATRVRRRATLLRLCGIYQLTPADIARLTDSSIWAAESWLRPPRGRSGRSIPSAKLTLLQMKLAAIAPASAARAVSA